MPKYFRHKFWSDSKECVCISIHTKSGEKECLYWGIVRGPECGR